MTDTRLRIIHCKVCKSTPVRTCVRACVRVHVWIGILRKGLFLVLRESYHSPPVSCLTFRLKLIPPEEECCGFCCVQRFSRNRPFIENTFEILLLCLVKIKWCSFMSDDNILFLLSYFFNKHSNK